MIRHRPFDRSASGPGYAGRFLPLVAVLAFLLAPPPPARAQKDIAVQMGQESDFRWPGYVPDELLVKFRDNVAPEARQAAVAAEGAELSRDLTDDGLVKIHLAPGQSVLGVLDRWKIGRAHV